MIAHVFSFDIHLMLSQIIFKNDSFLFFLLLIKRCPFFDLSPSLETFQILAAKSHKCALMCPCQFTSSSLMVVAFLPFDHAGTAFQAC